MGTTSSTSRSSSSGSSSYPGNRGPPSASRPRTGSTGGGSGGGGGQGGSRLREERVGGRSGSSSMPGPPPRTGGSSSSSASAPPRGRIVVSQQQGGGGPGRGVGGGGSTTRTTTTRLAPSGPSIRRGPVVHPPAHRPTNPTPRPSTNPTSPAPGSGGSHSTQMTQGPAAAQTLSRPGAYSISRNDAGPTQVFRVQVPPGVRPGQDFQVYAGSRVVRVRCPPDSRPGQSLQITVPPDPVVRQNLLGMAVLTSAAGEGGGGAVAMSETVAQANQARLSANRQSSGGSSDAGDSSPQQPNQSQSSGQQTPQPPPQQPTAYMVTVPPGIHPGMQFQVDVEGQRMMVTCPPTARAGMSVRISVPAPAPPGMEAGTALDRPPTQPSPPTQQQRITTQQQMFEVIVPPGVRPNQPFSLLAGGQRVLVTCPPNTFPGQKIRFQLQVPVTTKEKSIESIKLSYDSIKDGWTRTIRVTDMKFQWIRMDDNGDVDTNTRFDIVHSAYVRHLELMDGNDPRMRTGVVNLVPASEAVVDSKIVNPRNGHELVSHADLAAASDKPYLEKAAWFQETCKRLEVDWNEGHMRINVRRNYLLHDSVEAVMSLSRTDMNKIWRFEFLGEIGIDAGGLAREWFQLVTEQIFDPDNGLWLTASSSNQMAMRVNPASEVACPDDHLIYFRFLGRVMGKALFDRQLVAGHMARHMYKHILGWPVTFEDLELADPEYYENLKRLTDMEKDQIEYMCLDFTATEETMGAKKDVELMQDGANVEVTGDNLPEYLEANLKYRMLDRIKPQVTELLLGFFDVIPEPLMTVFDFQELELLMCGMPIIDMTDWRENTIYTGEFERTNGSHQACKWFWEVVEEDFDQETRARLLQFVTGTSGVPSRGFSVLQGNDGNIRKFCIHGVTNVKHFPRAHTCFNRIDLPMYKSKKDLKEKLEVAVTTSATGFGIE